MGWVVAGAVALVLGGWWLWQDDAPLVVRTVAVASGPVESSVSNTRAGTVKACRRSKLSMPIGGVVDRLLVDEGDRVERGQLLLELWNADQRAQVGQATAALETSRLDQRQACLLAELNERDLQRLRTLRARDMASEESVDTAQSSASRQRLACESAAAKVQLSQAALDLQQAILTRTQLHAPFAGIVAEVNGEIGEYVTPSPPGIPTPPAIDLIDYSCLYVTAPIDEVDASELRVGQRARVSLDAFRDRSFSGKVSRIAPYVLDLEKQARTVDVDVRLDEVPEDVVLLVGYSADITVMLERRESVLRIPSEALLAGDSVWILEGGVLKRRAVEVGIGDWTTTEIRKGLAAGDQVVINPDLPGIEEGVAARAEQGDD
ncbi:MAG TPA: efflux RND transporter periplasmic adaptor subunit [Spongiibacteraceae bacterium]|nr:efflux RND transporter periplasmic adaptor subunit [Spongiibacteraceae bacterium]